MAKGIDLSIAADTRSAMSAIQRGIIDPLEDVTDLLERTGRESKDAGNDLERSMRDAQRRTEDSKDEIRELRDELNKAGRAGKKAGDDIGDGVRAGGDGFARVKEGAQEVTQEIGQNLGEAVSSVRGNLADLGQVGQDTLGGLAATLSGTGPAGIAGAAVLAAGAVGLGLVTAELEKQQEEAAKFRERISDAYRGAAEDGRTFIDDQTKISAALDILFDPERAEDLKTAQKDAITLGLDLSKILAAQTGDTAALAEVQTAVAAVQQKALANENLAERWDKDLTALYGRWYDIGQVTDENARKAVTARQITSDYLLDAISKAQDATEEVDEFGNRLIHLPEGRDVVIDAKTGQASENLAKFRGDADGVIDHVSGRKAVIKVAADTSDADRALTRFINKGRQIKIGSKIVGPAGEWD
ncbi:MAG TPA: hypothetical protein VN041_09660 [Microbacterium sp.]|nr:hypothetical protein [Microbacterium sp.]